MATRTGCHDLVRLFEDINDSFFVFQEARQVARSAWYAVVEHQKTLASHSLGTGLMLLNSYL